MKFNQPLTYSEQECLAYISGDTELADNLDKLMEYEGDTDGYDIDDALGLLDLGGVRGERLYDALRAISDKLEDYEAAFKEMKGFTRISQVKDLIDKIEDEDS